MLNIDYFPFLKYLQIKEVDSKRMVLDPIRNKYLQLGPEETVRQLLLQYLINKKGYPKNKIAVEKNVKVNNRNKRFDILIYNQEMKPFLLVECKAPNIKITDKAMRQVAWYNMTLKVDFLLVTNGQETYCCKMDYETKGFEYLEEIPKY